MTARIAIAVVVAAMVPGCKGKTAAKPDPGSAAAASGADPNGPTLTLPVVSGEPVPADAPVFAITATGLRRLADGAAPQVGAAGRFAVPAGPLISTDRLDAALPRDATVVIAADTGAIVDGVVRPIVAGLGARCWGLAVAGGGAVEVVTLECPHADRGPDAEPPDLAMVVRHGGMLVGYARDSGLYAVDNAGALDAQLGDLKRSSAFVDRDDLAVAVEHDTTVGDLAAAAAAAHHAGFTHTYWVALAQLSTALQVAISGTGPGTGAGSGARTAPGTGAGSDRGSATGVAGSGAAAAPKIAIGPITGDLGGLDQAEVERVIKARAGVLRACYQRALTSAPDLEGELAVTIVVGADGVVTDVRTAGTLAKSEVATCAGNQLRRVRFSAKGKATLELTLRYAPR